jgi:CBS domain-containing protein
MADDLSRIGAFNESGRGLPINLSRPGGALPYSPLIQQAYAPTPRARLGWGAGVITCADVGLEEPNGVTAADSPRLAAQRLLDGDVGWLAVLEGPLFRGVVTVEAILRCVADDRFPPNLGALMSSQIPTCAPGSALVDAVREMMASRFRRIPVVGDHGELTGILSLSAAAGAAGRDPAVRDLLESATPIAVLARWR